MVGDGRTLVRIPGDGDQRFPNDLSRFSFFFCRSNCVRELNPIRYPLRIRFCHRNVIHTEHAKSALGKSYSFKLTFANARSVPVWLVIRPKLPTTPSRQ